MVIIGERINSTRPKIHEAIKDRNASVIIKEASAQLAAGANFLDVNCAVTAGDEVQDMDWLVSVVQSEIKNVSLCIDSPSYLAIERGLKIYKAGGKLMVNSITADENRLKHILPLALKYNANLVALTMDSHGMPDTAAERFEIARRIYERTRRDGFKAENLYFDPLIRPIATEPKQAQEFLGAIPMIKSLSGVKTICGLSNVSFGLPNRKLINSVFLVMALQAGLDAAILDPLDSHAISSITASKALLCNDEYCAGYIKAFREGKLV